MNRIENNEYEVKKILQKRIINGVDKFEVLWDIAKAKQHGSSPKICTIAWKKLKNTKEAVSLK